jgi:hypothetical protein
MFADTMYEIEQAVINRGNSVRELQRLINRAENDPEKFLIFINKLK